MAYKDQSVSAVDQFDSEFTAVRISPTEWRFEPPSFSVFATGIQVPPMMIIRGTYTQELDLYSRNPEMAVWAARWIIQQYLKGINQSLIEWTMTGIPEYEEPDGNGLIF